MLAMGFTDDDGWLTQLLTMKHGDIGQVRTLTIRDQCYDHSKSIFTEKIDVKN
jgi:hypothetical protein